MVSETAKRPDHTTDNNLTRLGALNADDSAAGHALVMIDIHIRLLSPIYLPRDCYTET